ncbi:hypothetical protein AB1Y20_001927 [Prymnesium parvum]|uniref:Uncharacterized protein n=1 Tax=Prymnesium parvum TaxID=97485 RepID=A0AB34JA24_PRYPA
MLDYEAEEHHYAQSCREVQLHAHWGKRRARRRACVWKGDDRRVARDRADEDRPAGAIVFETRLRGLRRCGSDREGGLGGESWRRARPGGLESLAPDYFILMLSQRPSGSLELTDELGKARVRGHLGRVN